MTFKECINKVVNGIKKALYYIFKAHSCCWAKDKSRYIELPCKVGEKVRFRGIPTQWTVTGLHFYDIGTVQINVTNNKVTDNMLLNSFKEENEVIKDGKEENEVIRDGKEENEVIKDGEEDNEVIKDGDE